MCLYPRLIRNPRYKENKKNGGQLPPIIDKRVLSIPIGCGNCMECRKQKQNMWLTRLIEDVRTNTNGKFVTLTFNNQSLSDLRAELILELNKDSEIITKKYKDKAKKYNTEYKLEGYDLDNAIATLAIRKFTNRWRKHHGKTIRHFLITELGHGKTEHLHLHGILWHGDENNIKETMDKIEKIWGYGYVWKGKEYKGKLQNYVNERTVNYIGKYITKIDQQHKEYRPIILCSNGIGKPYTDSTRAANNKFAGKETRDVYIKDNGSKINLPIYFRNKLYTDEEKEQLWLNKLDKSTRYINGIKIDVSKNYDEYFKILIQERKRNAKLGFGNNYMNWNRLEYENEIRKLKQEMRLNNRT
jgi:hypothetical protein